jgi:hypothetical protein
MSRNGTPVRGVPLPTHGSRGELATTNADTPSTRATTVADAEAEDALVVRVVRRWWPVAMALAVVAGAVWGAAAFVARQPTRADVVELVEARAVTRAEAKQLVLDHSPYNADRGIVHAIDRKLDQQSAMLSDIAARLAATQATAIEIDKRLDRLERAERRRDP